MKRYFDTLRNSPPKKALTIALVVIVLNALLYLQPVYLFVGADIALFTNNLTNVVTALLSVWLAYRLFRSFHHRESQRLIWGSLLAGLGLWMIAEITWDTYQLMRGIDGPAASPADIAWTLGYLAVICGLVLSLRAFRMRPTKPWQLAALAVFGVFVVLAVVYLIIPALVQAQAGSPYLVFVTVVYPLCDLVMAGLALVLVLVLEGGLLSRPWTAIALGCFFAAVSNLLYAFALSHGIFQVDPAAGLNLISYLVDTSYTFAYVMTALGMYLQARLQDAI